MKITLLGIASLILAPSFIGAKDISVADLAAFDAAVASAAPGDNIILREGEWVDTVLKFKCKGQEGAPVTLKAAVPGKTIFTGKSALRIGGEHLVVDGLWFSNPDPAPGDTIEFRLDSKNLASHCRLTQCAITLEEGKGTTADKESHWLGIYGANNRVDHCRLQGKTSKGTTLVVWLGEGQGAGHQIDHNYFGPRMKLGKNGGETIRVGDSKTSMQKASCVVEHNIFEKCNGEAECISNKSCGNLYRSNLFLEVSGTLTLRHGNGCTVEGNIFLGNDIGGTGGIRIIGEDHIVRGNYLEKLSGDDARSGICFMAGVPNSPLNRYFQVKRARVEGNTLVGCKHPLLIGLSDDKNGVLPPVETVISNNKVQGSDKQVVEARCDLAGITWSGNEFSGSATGLESTPGITWKNPEILRPEIPDRTTAGPTW